MRTPRHARPWASLPTPKGRTIAGTACGLLASSPAPGSGQDSRNAKGTFLLCVDTRLQSVDAGNPHQIQSRGVAHRHTGRPMGRRGGPVAPPHAMPGVHGRAGGGLRRAWRGTGARRQYARSGGSGDARVSLQPPTPTRWLTTPRPDVRARSSPARATATTIRKRGLRHVRDDGLRDCGALLPRAARANVWMGHFPARQ